MIFRGEILLILLVNLIVVTIAAEHSIVSSNRTCGFGKAANHVKFPFGFSNDSEIRLSCSDNGMMELEGFNVRNVTSDSIILDLPANCIRPIKALKPLFGQNYAPTLQNGLLLQNCTEELGGCMIPTRLLESRFALRSCETAKREKRNISCYTAADERVGFLNYHNISGLGCKYLFSSIVLDSSDGAGPEFLLEIQSVQLSWWLKGRCQCSNNANCSSFEIPGGSSGYRCLCNEGYEGDGFSAGQGCRKVSSARSRVAVLIGGVIAGALAAVIFLALSCYFIHRHCTSLNSHKHAKRLLCEAAGNSSVPLYPYREIERATNGFSDKQRLGTGAYGTVYAGKFHNNECVAIKKIKHRDAESIEQVMNEIKLLSCVSHPNLVRLLGCCIENGEQILVYEYMPNGTLSEHLQGERGNGLPWNIRLTIASETARAIAYLHFAMNPPIYHRDIKSSNILLDYQNKSKVADFGLSRLGMTETSCISTAPQGTPGYVDPQYHQNFHLSDKSDVYSFGVVLVEIITAMKVVDFSRTHTDVNLAALAVDLIGKGRVDEIIDPFLEPQTDAWTLSSIHKVAELAFRCLAYHRDVRPTMMEVADELERLRLSGLPPPEENMCMASSIASSCSSPYNGSERSLSCVSIQKGAVGRRLIVPEKGLDCLGSLKEVNDSSPVSVQDLCLSEHSSPSTNSLLGQVVRQN